MGLIIGLIKWILKLLIYFIIFALLIVLIPNLPPYTTFSNIELEPTQPRVGALAPNEALNNAHKLYKDKLLGPEAFAVYNGELYTSLATGEIVKVSPGGHVTFVTKIGEPCAGLAQEHICGRPLGFQIDEKSNTMYVADAYHGIWKVDLKTDKKQLLVSPQVEISGRQPKLFNSIALSKNGDLYWTDSSSDFYLKDGAYILLTDPTGRLFHYNAAKNESKVLLDNLWFANGLVISPDNQFVVVAESCCFRLMKYYIDGPKKGKSEPFVTGLPGTPDNVRTLPDGSGVLVGLYTVFDHENPLLTRSLSETPHVRKFLARLQRLIEVSFESLYNVYPHILLEEIVYHIGSFKSISGLTPSMSGLLQLDWNGNIVGSYYNTDGSLGHVSDAIVYNGKLLTGNPHSQNFIGTVPAPPSLLKAFTTKNVEPKGIPKPAPTPQQTKQDSKPVVQEKSKVEEKRETPKVVKPVATESPKVAPAKPAVTPKPTTQKPIEKKPAVETKPAAQASKTTQPPPKQTEQKQTPPPVRSEPEKKAPTQAKPTPKPDVKPTPKPDVKSDTKAATKPEITTTPPPKTADTKATTEKPNTKTVDKSAPKPDVKPTPKPDAKPTPKPDAKPTAKPEVKPTAKPEIKTTPPPKNEEKKRTTEKPTPTKPIPQQDSKSKPEVKKPVKDTPKPTGNKPAPQEIPIKEEIPSDTIKPNKETLKVIKRGGPAEIPNPNL